MRAIALLVPLLLVATSNESAAANADSGARQDEPKNPFVGRATFGVKRRWFLGTAAWTKDVGLAFGGTTGSFAGYAVFRYEWGETTFGLPTRALGCGGFVEWSFGRPRLGAGLDVLSFGVRRAARDEWIERLGFAARIALSIDVVDWSGGALFLGIDAHGTALAKSAFSYASETGASAFFGLRL